VWPNLLDEAWGISASQPERELSFTGSNKLPDLLGLSGDDVRGQVLAGSVAAAIAAYVSVRFLSRYFTRRTLTPFAVYSLVVGVLALLRFGL
jgi:undecaprenyl-diphosphatase